MTTSIYTLLFLGSFLLILSWVAWQSRYHDKGNGFIIGHRELKFSSIFGSIISFLHAGDMFFWWFVFVALFGFGALWVSASLMATLVIMALFAPLATQLSRENNYITFPDLIRDRQGPWMEKWMLYGSLYGAIIIAAAQLFVAGQILSGLLPISAATGTVVSALVVALYVVLGGFLSVVRTDVYQAVVIILIAIAALLFGDWPTTSTIGEQLFSTDINLIASYAIIGLCLPVNTDLWQRFFATKDPRQARNATLAAFVINQTILMVGVVLFISNMLATAPDTDPQRVFIDLFSNNRSDTLVVSLLGVFIVSALLSTLDNQVLNFTTISTKNLLRIDPFQNRDRFIGGLRIMALAFLTLLTALLLTFQTEDLLSKLFTSYAVLGILTPFIFYAIAYKSAYQHRDKILALGVLVCIFFYWVLFYFDLYKNALWYIVPYICIPAVFISMDYCFRFSINNDTIRANSTTIKVD